MMAIRLLGRFVRIVGPQSFNEFFIGMMMGQGNCDSSDRAAFGTSPERSRRDVSRNDTSGLDDRPLADPNVGKDDAMRSDKNVFLDDDFAGVVGRAFRPPIEMGDDGRPQADAAIVADRYGFGMQFIEIDILTDPDLLSDMDASKPVEEWPQTVSSRHLMRYFAQESLKTTA
jgi:hypothetical protein